MAGGSAQEARALALAVRDRLPAEVPGAVAVGTQDGALVLALNDTAREAGLYASQLVKQLLGGRGGGSAEVAQGGGLGPDGVAGALAALPPVIAAS